MTRPNPLLIVTLALAGLALASCQTTSNQSELPPLTRFEYSQPQMGVPWRMVLYARDTNTAVRAARAGFQEVARLNAILSDYETDSELNELCYQSGSGEPVKVSEDLWTVLERAHLLARRTRGAFDPTIGPVAALWRKARRESALPDPEVLEATLARVGYEKMILHPKTKSVELTAKDMRLDLGGIAKGYALDQALKAVQQEAVTRVLITAGGDMVAGEAPPGRDGWYVELAPLDAPNAPPARTVRLRHFALATSGDLFQHLKIGGVRYSHIVDPRTGIGLTDQSLVHVLARTAMTADSVATAVSVLGPHKGIDLVESMERVDAYVVRRPGEQIEAQASRRFQDYLVR